MQKLKISKVIVVEGKYDKIKLSSIVEGTVVTLDGFGIFNNSEKQFLLRELAAARGLIVLTDSDPAGGFLRGKLRTMLPKDGVIHLYTPQIQGKERRKKEHSKAGLLGVEGMETDKLREILSTFADDAAPPACGNITKTDFYTAGLSGGADSTAKREKLAAYVGLPSGMTANAMIEAMNLLGKELPPQELYM